jgi:hypothetical protein
MDAVTTAAGALRLAAALTTKAMRTRRWDVSITPALQPLLRVGGRMQESADGFALGILLPIVLALAAALRFKRGLAMAGIESVGAPLCLFAASVPLQIIAVHVAALDVVAGRGWARWAEG